MRAQNTLIMVTEYSWQYEDGYSPEWPVDFVLRTPGRSLRAAYQDVKATYQGRCHIGVAFDSEPLITVQLEGETIAEYAIRTVKQEV